MLEHLSGLIIQFISSWGYVAVFVLMTLESVLIPIPSEITMPFAGFLAQQGHLLFIGIVLCGALGNLVGSLLAYALGYYLEETVILGLIDRYGKFVLIRRHEYEKSMHWFKKYGNGIAFFSRLVPGIRTFISLPAGLSEMNIWKFSIYSFLGSCVWSAFLTSIGFFLGKNWGSMHTYFSKLHYVIGALLVAGVVYYIYKHKDLLLAKKK